MTTVKAQRSLRSEQVARTKDRILQASEEVFAELGFAGARIEDVADRAGVALPTVYKVFTNKRNLLVGALTRAMTGGDIEGVDQQLWFAEQLEEPDPFRQLALVARNARRINERAGAVLEAVRAAAPTDEDLAHAWSQVTKDRMVRSRKTARSLLEKLGQHARLNSDGTTVTLLSLTAPEVYTAHLEAGRTANQYEDWLVHVLCASLLGPTVPEETGRHPRADL